MKNVTKLFKIWLAITLVIAVVGMTLFGIFGTNKTADMSVGYEIEVSVDSVVNDETAEKLKTTSEKYLNDNGYGVIADMTQIVNDGEIVRFKVSNLSADEVTTLQSGLKTAVETVINEGGLKSYVVTVGTFQSLDNTNYNWAYGSIAFAIVAVAVFVYYAFMEKLSGALSVLSTMAISAILFIAMIGGIRLPVDPYFGVGIAFAVALTGVLSGGIINRCRELTKNVANDKKSFIELADTATWSSLTRFAVVLGAVLVVSLLLVILGSTVVKFLAVQLVVATLVSMFTAYAWSGFFWATFKKFSKVKKYKPTESKKIED